MPKTETGYHNKRTLLYKHPPRCPMCDALMLDCLCRWERTYREIWEDYLRQFETERKQTPFDLKR